MRKLFFLLMSLALMMSCNKCKERCDDPTNPECPNYQTPNQDDPCLDAELTTANFQMFQNLPIPNELDSSIQFYKYCFLGSAITLHAIQDSADYHWIIGANHYYTRDVTFSFGAQWEDQNIELKLIVTRAPDSFCYPNDNGVDTVSKIVVPRHECNASFWGHYFGAWENQPNDSFEISFTYDGISSCFPLMITGAKPGIDTPCEASGSYFTDNYLVLDGTSNICYWPVGVVKLDSSLNKIRFDYSTIVNIDTSEPREYHTFHGHRIN
jgi:hypothetical protein